MKQQQKYKEQLMIAGQIHSSCQSTAVNSWHKWQDHSSAVCGDCVVPVCKGSQRCPGHTWGHTHTHRAGQCQSCLSCCWDETWDAWLHFSSKVTTFLQGCKPKAALPGALQGLLSASGELKWPFQVLTFNLLTLCAVLQVFPCWLLLHKE